MAAMDEELAELSCQKSKPAPKVVKDVSRTGPSGKIKPNVSKLSKENVRKLTRDYESTDEEDDEDENSDNSDPSSQSSDLFMEARARKSAPRKTGKKVGSVSQYGLGQQQTLEGDALELVSGQLLLPESIPHVIEKLRRHFGRPEQLLQSLLDKVNRLEPPKPDNLRSFVPFGNTVEQLCGHLEATDLQQHLVNPLLIKSLVAKLPDREKREWVHYRRGRGETTLRTLTDFLMDIVADACEANVDVEYVEFHPPPSSKAVSQCGKERLNEVGLYCHCEANSSANYASEERKLKPCKMWHCADFKKLRYTERLKLVTCDKLCHVCLNEHGGQCKFKIRCNIGDCREFHNPLMHPVENTVGLSAHIRTNCTDLFRIVPVQLHYGGKMVSVLAFLEEGASVTLVEKKHADRLGAVGVQERLTIRWTGNMSREEDSRRMSLWASGTSGAAGDTILLNRVHTVGKLMLPHQRLDSQEIAAQYEHIRGLPIESYNGQPQLLIGVNNIYSFAPIEAKVGTPMEPIAVRTNLGWTVYGPRQTTSAEAGYHQQLTNVDLPEQLNSHYALEKSVVAIPQEATEKERAREILGRNIKHVGGRWQQDVRFVNKYGRVEIQSKMINSSEALRNLRNAKPATLTHLNRDVQQTAKERVRGGIWDPTTDQFAFSTRLRGELIPHRYKENRSKKKLVAIGSERQEGSSQVKANPEKVTIDRRKEKHWATVFLEMRALDDGRKFTEEVLTTTFVEAIGMVNPRPYVPKESLKTESLSSNHFLRGTTVSGSNVSPDNQPTDKMVRRSAAAPRGRIGVRGRQENPDVLEKGCHRCGIQGFRRTGQTGQSEDADGKIKRRSVVNLRR